MVAVARFEGCSRTGDLAAGASINFQLIISQLLTIAAIVLVLIAVKGFIDKLPALISSNG